MRSFKRCNINNLTLESVCAHGGEGAIEYCRVTDGQALSGACNFIDVAVLPPGATIGRHRHPPDEEEFYLVLAGTGQMFCNGEEFTVRAGDLVRNPPGAEHGLRAVGPDPLRLFVFELRVP